MTRRIFIAIAALAAFAGEAAAQQPDCGPLRRDLEFVLHLRDKEKKTLETLAQEVPEKRRLLTRAGDKADNTNAAEDWREYGARRADYEHANISLGNSKHFLGNFERKIAEIQFRIWSNCNQQPAASTPPPAKPAPPQTAAAPPPAKPPTPQAATAPQPAKPPAPPSQQSAANPPPAKPPAQPTPATRPAFDLRGNVRTYCEITPTFMDYAPVEVSVNAKGEAIGGFYRKGKTLLMKGEMDGGGVIRLKVLDAPEIVIEVRTSKSQGLWHGTGTFVNPPAEVSRCYPGNIGLSESKVLPDPMRFPNPTFRGYAVSNCRDFHGVGCGLPAATAFCLTAGYFRATEHKVVVDGAQAWVLGSDKVCNDPACGHLVDVVCTRK